MTTTADLMRQAEQVKDPLSRALVDTLIASAKVADLMKQVSEQEAKAFMRKVLLLLVEDADVPEEMVLLLRGVGLLCAKIGIERFEKRG